MSACYLHADGGQLQTPAQSVHRRRLGHFHQIYNLRVGRNCRGVRRLGCRLGWHAVGAIVLNVPLEIVDIAFEHVRLVHRARYWRSQASSAITPCRVTLMIQMPDVWNLGSKRGTQVGDFGAHG